MASLKDIATALGVNISTVSRALNDSHEISKATKQLIHEKARELNYMPNLAARTLSGKSTKSIGLIIPEVKSDYYAQITNFIEQELREFGYSLIIGITDFSSELEIDCLLTLSSRKVDGIIFCNNTSKNTTKALDILTKEYSLPIIMIDPFYPVKGFDTLNIDNYSGISEAVTHLAELNRTHIAYIGDEISSITRYSSYKKALAANNLHFDERLTAIGTDRFERGGYLRMNELLESSSPLPDAVFAAYDDMAIGVLKALYESGVSIPGDIAVVGYDNIRYTEFLFQPLTTINSPLESLSKTSVKFLSERINQGQNYAEPRQVSFPTHLVIRKTTLV
jgi:LacI family transcriptional regulator